jgi:hypothetical protein
MKPSQNHLPPRWALIVLLILGVSLCLFWLWEISFKTNFGSSDFIGYWSATHLLVKGENPYDPALMEMIQKDIEMGWDVTIMAWNPPLLFVFLLPLGWLSFTTAKFIWMIVSIMIFLGASLMLMEIYIPKDRSETRLLFLLFAICLPQMISGLYMGQVTFLVFFGMTASLFLLNKGYIFWAGAVLALIFIKPHLVVLSLVYVLIYMARKRQFEGWVGLTVAGMKCILILFFFRPIWIQDLLEQMNHSPINWFTPTIGGFISYLGISENFNYVIFLLLPLPVFLAWCRPEINPYRVVAFLTLITVPLTFFGWSYDQIILLIPIAQIFIWVSLLEKRSARIWFTGVILFALALVFIHRIFSQNDVFQIWFPFFWWIIYFSAWRLSGTSISVTGLSERHSS